MIQLKKVNLFSMALLASAATFTGCSSDEVLIEEEVAQAPAELDYKEAVKTQFAINIPAAGSNKRLTEANVQGQEAPQFRGIQAIRMFPFNAEITGASTLGNSIELGSIDADGLGAANSKFYTEVSIPVNTSHMLFYAQGGTASDSKQANGSLIYKNTAEINGSGTNYNPENSITFSLEQIGDKNETIESAFTTALNAIAGVAGFNSAATQQLYNNFTGLKSGSAANILYTVNELYTIAKERKTTAEGDVYTAIINAITNSNDVFNVEENKVSYKEGFAGKDYPTNLNLPAGVAQLKFEGNQFSYLHTATAPTISTMSAADFSDYVYPASLYYYANTPIKASSSDTEISAENTWADFVNALSQTKVDYNSQMVALANPVQYGVGHFVVIPKFNATTVSDGKAQTVNIANGTFTVKGILVGGQKNVTWEFKPQSSSPTYTIYDQNFDEATNGVTSSSTNKYQTLVLETEGATTTEGTTTPETVKFAIEMVNNGEAFYGLQGIIPAGGIFYLVGMLSTDENSNTGYKEGKIFAQDYTTEAKVTIKSLKDAYSVVPDLKSTKLKFGLSVDLTWKEGHTQDVTIE